MRTYELVSGLGGCVIYLSSLIIIGFLHPDDCVASFNNLEGGEMDVSTIFTIYCGSQIMLLAMALGAYFVADRVRATSNIDHWLRECTCNNMAPYTSVYVLVAIHFMSTLCFMGLGIYTIISEWDCASENVVFGSTLLVDLVSPPIAWTYLVLKGRQDGPFVDFQRLPPEQGGGEVLDEEVLD